MLQKAYQEVQITAVRIESWDRERWRRTLLFKSAELKYLQAVGPLKAAIRSIISQDGPKKEKNKVTASHPNSWKVILVNGRRDHAAATTSVHRAQTGGEFITSRHRLGSSIWDSVTRDTLRLFLSWKWDMTSVGDHGISKLHTFIEFHANLLLEISFKLHLS